MLLIVAIRAVLIVRAIVRIRQRRRVVADVAMLAVRLARNRAIILVEQVVRSRADRYVLRLVLEVVMIHVLVHVI